MTNIHTSPDIEAVLQTKLRDYSELTVVEGCAQPKGYSPRVGWDFLAPEDARQFQVEVGRDWAIITLDIRDDGIVLDVPGYSLSGDALLEVVVQVASAVSEASGAKKFHGAKERDAQDFSQSVLRKLNG